MEKVSWNTISVWLYSVINLAYASALEEDCRFLRARAHEVRKVATSLLFNPSPLVLIYSRQSQNVQSFDPSGST